MNEVRFVGRRVVRALIVVLGLTVVTFFMARLMANPVDVILPLSATAEQREALEHSLGLDQSLPVQFLDYAGDALRGDFGDSVWSRQPAIDTVLSRLPASILLATAASLVAVVLGLGLGIAGGMRPGSLVDRLASLLAALSVAIPDFWLGILLILVFAVHLDLLPTAGTGGLEHLILPAATLSLRPAGRLARVAREAVMDEMRKDYVVAARARGLGETAILHQHVLKNIAVPTSAVFGYDFLMMFTGTP